MGGCRVLQGAQPAADKHCQLAEGPCSSAVYSQLITRTHPLHQVQANTKPFPWALGFILIFLLMSIKKLYYDANYGTVLGSIVKTGGGKEQASYCIAPLLLSHNSPRSIRDLIMGQNKNHVLGLVSLNTLWRGQILRIDQFLMAAFCFACLEWLMWSVSLNKNLFCCPKAWRCIVGGTAASQDSGHITWLAGGMSGFPTISHALTTGLCFIFPYFPPENYFSLTVIAHLLPVVNTVTFYHRKYLLFIWQSCCCQLYFTCQIRQDWLHDNQWCSLIDQLPSFLYKECHNVSLIDLLVTVSSWTNNPLNSDYPLNSSLSSFIVRMIYLFIFCVV